LLGQLTEYRGPAGNHPFAFPHRILLPH
jgi:hypothetical protein